MSLMHIPSTISHSSLERRFSIILGFCMSKLVIYSALLGGLSAFMSEEKGPPWKEPAVANL